MFLALRDVCFIVFGDVYQESTVTVVFYTVHLFSLPMLSQVH